MTGDLSARRRAIFASIAGNMLEWYDFFLFAAASATVFAPLFFPLGGDPLVGMMAAFSTYAVGFAARPLGGLLFGHVGDRFGRKAALVWTLSLMGVATFAIGLLPTHDRIGIWAPVMLVALRIVQGIAAGGEWGGGVLMITENTPADRRGMLGALSQTGVGLGFVLASLAFWAAHRLGDTAFLAWGWRLPFLASLLLLLLGLFIRKRVGETAGYEAAGEDEAAGAPVLTVIRRHPRAILIAIGLRLAENGTSHLFQAFAIAYGTQAGLSVETMLAGSVLAMLADSLMMPVYGAASDRFGRRPVYLAGILGAAAFAYPFFLMLGSGSAALAIMAMLIGNGLCHAAMIGVQPALFTEMFPAHIRYSGLAMAHEVSSVIVGIAPLVATMLLARYHHPAPVALYLALLCTISAAALWWSDRAEGE